MTTKLLEKKEVELFIKETGIKANKVLLVKNKRNYYVIILDNAVSVKIPKELAEKLL